MGVFDHRSFTGPAEQASYKKGAITIMLLDAEAIARLMLERGIGVSKQPVVLVELDPAFFDFE